MTPALLLGLAAALLAAAGVREMIRERDPGAGPVLPSARGAAAGARVDLEGLWGELARRLALAARIERAGLGGRIEVRALLAAKCAGAIAGAGFGLVAAPAAPGRLSILVALALPAAGFLAPDALLERRARHRGIALRGALPDALDLLATAAAAGRSPLAGFAEIAKGEGPLARELSVLVAETSCGASQSEALESLRERVPAQELAALCGVVDRSRRYGSPLADQLYDQASSLRGTQRRRIGEQAARAAPKIQLAVALLLVPSVLLMIAAGLLANMDRFLAGI
jgi:tight adherence protein C